MERGTGCDTGTERQVMKERGILYTPDNIRAVMNDQKTQTRRVAKFPSWVSKVQQVGEWFTGEGTHPVGECEHPKCSHIGGLCGNGEPSMFTLKSPYGTAGDRLYIKEGVIVHPSIPQLCGYYIDGCRVTAPWEKRLTAMFMPKWAARTWLEIADIRVERLNDISEEDCESEGIFSHIAESSRDKVYRDKRGETAKEYFRELWDSINSKKHPWSSNPFVWAISFRKI